MKTIRHSPLQPQDNQLLGLLDAGTLDALRGDLTLVETEVPDVLHEEGAPFRAVYFPVRCVTSMLAAVEGSRSRVEVATSGREGMAGLGVYLGARHSPGRTFIQVKGESWRMPAAAFRDHATALPAFGDVLRRYAHVLFVMASQCSACNRVHSPRQRCARWLLMSADRVAADEFNLSQEFLGHMLGERRPTVSKAAGELKMAGCIDYSRGHVVIRNRRKLEEAACDCYHYIRKEHEAVLGRLP